MFWLCRRLKVREPYNLIFPFIMAGIAVMPLAIDQLRSMALGQVQATAAAMGVEAQAGSALLTEAGTWFGIAFSGLIAIGVALCGFVSDSGYKF